MLVIPPDFQPHRGGKRFHFRTVTPCISCGTKWQVYGLGLDHICYADTYDAAKMIADALESAADPVTAIDEALDAIYPKEKATK